MTAQKNQLLECLHTPTLHYHLLINSKFIYLSNYFFGEGRLSKSNMFCGDKNAVQEHLPRFFLQKQLKLLKKTVKIIGKLEFFSFIFNNQNNAQTKDIVTGRTNSLLENGQTNIFHGSS